MRVALACTVKNERATIDVLLDSLAAQSRPPDEIVVVDGGSADGTAERLAARAATLGIRLVRAPGANIARGRNLAIAATSADIVAVTDAGVRLAPTWLERLMAPFAAPAPPDVVAGFFWPEAETPFERAMAATVLPTLDDVRPASFLPSSRSVAFRRVWWERVGGYPEWLDYGEDLVFDLALRAAGARFAFAPDAVVFYRPRQTLPAFFLQYFRYARGDGKADLWRHRHAVRYAAYAGGLLLLHASRRWPGVLVVLGLLGGLYLRRPYERLAPYLTDLTPSQRMYAIALVPLIRVVGDVAKMLGYPVGVWWRWRRLPIAAAAWRNWRLVTRGLPGRKGMAADGARDRAAGPIPAAAQQGVRPQPQHDPASGRAVGRPSADERCQLAGGALGGRGVAQWPSAEERP